jgi:hypothetical protein
MDAGTPSAYGKVKGVPDQFFYQVLVNMHELAKDKHAKGSKTQIGYKFVLDKDNWETIYHAAELAKQVGANHFQFRPAIDPDYKFFADKLPQIKAQIEKAQNDLDGPRYKVMGVFHKFNQDLSKKHNFQQCRANLLTTTWAADGWVYMCTDTRGNEWSKLVRHYPDPTKVRDYWGSEEHLEKVSKIDFKRNCDRCTLSPYNEMFEQVFIEDRMDRNLI